MLAVYITICCTLCSLYYLQHLFIKPFINDAYDLWCLVHGTHTHTLILCMAHTHTHTLILCVSFSSTQAQKRWLGVHQKGDTPAALPPRVPTSAMSALRQSPRNPPTPEITGKPPTPPLAIAVEPVTEEQGGESPNMLVQEIMSLANRRLNLSNGEVSLL